MPRRSLARARARALGRAATSCRKPTYGRVISGGILSSLVRFAGAGLGAFTGAALVAPATRGMNFETEHTTKVIAGSLGAIIGYGAATYPGLLVNRAILRTPECRNPSLGKIFIFDLVAAAITFGAGAAARAVEPVALPTITGVTTFVTMPFLGKAMIKE